VMLVRTGLLADGWGDEDAACGDWIEARLRGTSIDPRQIQDRVRLSKSGRYYDGARNDFPSADLELALQIDTFDFVMEAFEEEDMLVLRKLAAEMENPDVKRT
jgi:hypothetical protein